MRKSVLALSIQAAHGGQGFQPQDWNQPFQVEHQGMTLRVPQTGYPEWYHSLALSDAQLRPSPVSLRPMVRVRHPSGTPVLVLTPSQIRMFLEATDSELEAGGAWRMTREQCEPLDPMAAMMLEAMFAPKKSDSKQASA